ncbi:hypothetical protein [Sorangium sp. So ce887]|uniref:hypothetical protein n=1 Tax=Sorangium sp. So ce887 TaxID=3133324 RepID=UPI003F5DDB5F
MSPLPAAEAITRASIVSLVPLRSVSSPRNARASPAACACLSVRGSTHTEARIARIPLQAGDTMIIQGQYPPCPSCKGAMRNTASSSGAEIHYFWENQRWTAGGK